MLDEYQVKAIGMVYQPIMALYSYSVTSGIVVDIGERCDVVPVIDGMYRSLTLDP
jgi:actin-related protein